MKSCINSVRLKIFFEENITSKYKNKVIILYQHFINAIDHYFLVLLKSKLEGLIYNELKLNIIKILNDIFYKKYYFCQKIVVKIY